MSIKDFQDFYFIRVYNDRVISWMYEDPCRCMASICMIKRTIFGYRIIKGKNIKMKDLTSDNIFVKFEKRGVEES